jgi:CheY-like chemotaxis protein
VKTLRERGYNVLEAGSGPAALEMLHHQDGKVDLLLTDVVMPGGISGLELAQQIQGKRNLKVMLMSGYNLEVAQHGIPTQAGVNYLSKPFTGRTLARAVRECLDKN